MVKVREAHPELDDGSIDIQGWVARLPPVAGQADPAKLVAACERAQVAERTQPTSATAWGTGASCFRTGLEMAEILADLNLDNDSLVAAVLYRAVREGRLPLADVEAQFGAGIARLIDGVLRMAAISRARFGDEQGPVLGRGEDQSDTVRKMLVALVDDVRVALIKLAERTCAIRAVKDDNERRQRVAREVADIYAPLAHRLGIGHIKWELEDLSFRYLQPVAYKKIAKLLDERRLDRQRYIDELKVLLQKSLSAAGIEAELSGRAKHIFSIWKKMQRKGIGFSQVYDIRAVRILVNNLRDCYAALGIVHGLWRNVPDEFDDYIASPKDNGYRSLHTAVIGPEGKILEVQIRSRDMHEEAEFGVCAHWRYKGSDHGDAKASGYEEKIAWLRQVLDWYEETGGRGDIAEHFSRAQDRVYVFTRDGHVVNLAQGATPLDFAYSIHTEVGHRCRGAKVNGRIVPLTYTLKTGEQVEVITGREDAPRRDWLQPALGYLKTQRARAKVQAWYRQQAREDNIAAGRALLEKEFKRLALTSLDYRAVAQRLHCVSVEDMYAQAGAGDLGANQVLAAAQALVGLGREAPETLVTAPRKPRRRGAANLQIGGVGNLLTQIAGCCKPVPGDAILGFITKERGVSIHRQDCHKIIRLHETQPQRVVEVSWDGESRRTYPVDIEITAYDRQGLLRDITQLLAGERVNVLSVQTLSDTASNTATLRLTVEITGLAALSELLNHIQRLRNVISANRVGEIH